MNATTPIYSRRPNWRRIFCRLFGHEWARTQNLTAPQYQQLSCMRCYCCVYVGNPWRES